MKYYITVASLPRALTESQATSAIRERDQFPVQPSLPVLLAKDGNVSTRSSSDLEQMVVIYFFS